MPNIFTFKLLDTELDSLNFNQFIIYGLLKLSSFFHMKEDSINLEFFILVSYCFIISFIKQAAK